MKPHRGIAILSVLFCASCQVQQYIDNEDLRIYNTPIGKTSLIEPSDVSCTERTPEANAAPRLLHDKPASATTQHPLPPSVQSGSDWTEESPGGF